VTDLPAHVTVRRDALLAARNADGGWGYLRAKGSRLEPTCLALLAVRGGDDAGAHRLEGWQRESGLLVEDDALPANCGFNGLALLTMCGMPDLAVRADALARGLTRLAGVTTQANDVVRLDGRLRGWPWIDGTFSWVEPTSWCLLGLKKWRGARTASAPGLDERIDEAERMLADRACVSGGWNYGNPNVFGRDLGAYAPTTAIALLALQDDRQRSDVATAARRLEALALSEPSLLSLGLSVVAMCILGIPVRSLEEALQFTLSQADESVDLAGFGAATYALEHERHGCAAFRV
jgi:hypothetical protein